MAIDLKSLKRPTGGRPIVATLFGEGGMGKSTLAAMFPAPVFIRTEDGMASLDGHPDLLMFDIAKSTTDVFEQIEALASQEHDRKTLVIDSVTQFEKLAIREILDDETNPKAKNMAAAHGGYGKAYGMLDKKHQDLREAADYLVTDCGMNVVFIAHATTEVTITTRAGRLNGDMTVGTHQFWTRDHAMTVHGGGTAPRAYS